MFCSLTLISDIRSVKMHHILQFEMKKQLHNVTTINTALSNTQHPQPIFKKSAVKKKVHVCVCVCVYKTVYCLLPTSSPFRLHPLFP